jgi:ketosteroid isomerase-like protein
VTKKDFSAVTSQLSRAADDVRGDARENVRSVQAELDAIGRGDFEAVLHDAHDDVTLEIFAPPEFPWIRQAHGLADLRAALLQNFGSVEDQRPTIRDVFAEGDTVILFGAETGRIRGSGLPYQVEFVERFTFRDGRLAAIRIVGAYATPK